MIKAYLAAPIFTERDRNFNSYLEAEILKLCPDLDLYLSQNNKSINDKSGCATSADIYVGDVKRLKAADLLITVMSGDVPPIGSSYETAYFCGLCENDAHKMIVGLYDDSRDGALTYSDEKRDAMLGGVGENQHSYINLLATGYVKKWGIIVNNSSDLIQEVKRAYDILNNSEDCGIYKITNLKNNLSYIGQSIQLNSRRLDHFRNGKLSPEERTKEFDKNNELYNDMYDLGLEYFKYEILEKCSPEKLDEREKYWISYYDTYNNGYNKDTGGSGVRADEDWTTEQTIEVYSYFLDGTFDRKYNSIAAAIRDRKLKSNNITRCIAFNDNQHQSGDRMWSYIYREKMEPYSSPINGLKIYAYDLSTRKFIKGYPNASIAGNELTGKRQPHINDVAAGNRKSCCGFIWAYDYYDVLPLNYFKNINSSEGEEDIEHSNEH